MKKIYLTLLPAIALLAGIISCQSVTSVGFVRGSGNVIDQERPVSGIRQVALTTRGDLTIQTGEEEKLVISAEDNLLPYLTSRVSGGRLEIGSQTGASLRPTQPIRYTLTIKALQGLQTSSSGNIQAPELQASNFTIKVSSSGDIQVAALTADRLDVEISSSGEVSIEGGEVGEQRIRISSSGNYNALNMASQRADVNLTSSGDANLQASDSLTARLSSSGNVSYAGSPQVDWSSSSSGEVRAAP